jgi:hypothetical protein
VALGNTDNNPGNLLGGPGQPAFQGITGTTNANGLGYDVFATPQLGVRALVVDLTTAVKNGSNTLITLVAHYLGNPVKNGVIQPTKNNPNPQNYLTTVEQVSGLSANAQINSGNVGGVAQGIIRAEGSTVDPSVFSQGVAMAGAQPPITQAQSSLQGAVSSFETNFGAGANAFITDPVAALGVLGNTIGAGTNAFLTQPAAATNFLLNTQAAGASTIAGAASDTATQAAGTATAAVAGATADIAGSISGIQGFFANIFSAQTAQRGTFVVVGIGLLFIGGLVLLASSLAKAANNNPGAVAAIAA